MVAQALETQTFKGQEMRRLIPLLLLFVFQWFGGFGQNYKVSGVVVNSSKDEKLAFVNITFGKNKGVITDLNGNFSIDAPADAFPLNLKFSYVGFHDTVIVLNKAGNYSLKVALKPQSFVLNEVVVLPGENPAHRIIKKAVQNRDKNNPEKALSSFYYKSYNKMYFTALKKDKIVVKGDTVFYVDTASVKNDTSKTAKLLKKQHIFLIETVSERYFEKPDKNYEKIIASRVSGFTIPTFIVLATQFQSFSFYNPQINLLDKKYLSPLANGSWKKYLFQLIDTAYYGENDTVFIIKFRPRKGKNFDGLKGVLYITTDDYAIKNVIAEPVEQKSFYIKVRQSYHKIDSIWMPWQLNSNMIFNDILLDSSYVLAGVNNTYLFDVMINSKPDTLKPKFGNLDVTKEAFKNPESRLAHYRLVPLTAQDSLTYHIIDSIGKAEHLDLKYKTLTTLVSGKIPIGFVNIDIMKLLNYNLYEKFRLGLGLETNDELSGYFSLGGYYAYSFGIKKHSYGGLFSLYPSGKKNFGLYAGYADDVTETGGYEFYRYRPTLSSTESYRLLYLKSMEYEIKRFGGAEFRKRGLSGKLEYTNADRMVAEGYDFAGIDGQKYSYDEAVLRLRFAFREQVMNTPDGIFELGTTYPLVYVNLHYGILNGDNANRYKKAEILVAKTFDFNLAGKFTLHLTGGMVDGNLPLGMLYDMRGSNYKDVVFVSNTFQTMPLCSFYASKFVSGHFYYDFKSLLFRAKHFAPDVVLAYSAGWGELPDYKMHKGLEFEVPDKLYSEGGILINNILVSQYTGIGAGVFYKLGAYASPQWKENFVFKFSLMFLLD